MDTKELLLRLIEEAQPEQIALIYAILLQLLTE